MREHAAIRPRGPFVELVERLLAPTRREDTWAADVTDVARSIFPNATLVNFQVVEFDSANVARRCRLAVPEEPTRALLELAIAARQPLCPAGLVRFKVDAKAPGNTSPELSNVISLVAHPVPGIVTAIGAIFDHEPTVGRSDRVVLNQLAMHLEAAHRLRLRPRAVEAVISSTGRVLSSGRRGLDADALRAGVADVRRARSSSLRCTPDGMAVWSALQSGHMSLMPRTAGKKLEYLVLHNPPEAHSLRALSLEEASTLRLACRGVSNKLIGYALGASPATISSRLASAASKIGLASRTELIRVGAFLVRDERGEMSDGVLSEAERDILTLLRRGLSNQEIAGLRSRSVRTIANQVAALLRKTQSASRRELLIRPIRPGAN